MGHSLHYEEGTLKGEEEKTGQAVGGEAQSAQALI
jgi:hypothetical protein